MSQSSRWTDALLDSMRARTDADASVIINDVLSSPSLGAQRASQIFEVLQSTHSAAVSDLPTALQNYFKDDSLPTWADPKLIRKGEAFFNRLGPACVLSLVMKALPECYAGAHGAEVLYRTGRLNEKRGHPEALARRIAETAQFILDVMAPGGLIDGGIGVTSAKKVRLIHAAIRHYLEGDSWDSETYGAPINQEDLAGTMLAFSVATIRGLEKLGFPMHRDERDAYYHAWLVAGHYVGVCDELLPLKYDDGAALWDRIGERQYAPSEAGQVLTAALLEFLTHYLPTAPDEKFPRYLLRYLTGDRIADMLGVDRVEDVELQTILAIVRRTGKPIEKELEHAPAMREISAFASRWMMESFVHRWNQGKKVHFTIPPSLCKDWKIRTRWDRPVWTVGPLFGYRLAIERSHDEILPEKSGATDDRRSD